MRMLSMIRRSAALSISVTKSFCAFSTTVNVSKRSMLRAMTFPACRAARIAMFRSGWLDTVRAGRREPAL